MTNAKAPPPQLDVGIEIRTITPDNGKRYASTTEANVCRLGFQWYPTLAMYAIAPPGWSDEQVVNALEGSRH